ncbi:MAG TPA: pilus assembly protein PilP [Gammaproteobacteria bacterium]|nr:pilus assembly protein PilP [Gammaproteobacteria bacterium]
MQISTIARVLLLLPLLLLGGCVSNDMSDLRQYVDEVLARKGGRIEPIPEIKPYEAYAYKAAEQGMRNPFELFYGTREEVMQDEDAGLTAEMEHELRERNREELEQYELDSLRMVGTLEDDSTQWGIVLDPDGVVHRVKVGNYLGRNVGKILNIYEDRIELREIIRNSQGRWEERQAAIALAEE